jgi:arsenite methyltransferase
MMKYFHQQPLVGDYRLRIPYIRSIIAAGVAAIALGRATRRSARRLGTLVTGVGVMLLALAVGFWGFVQLFQAARNRLRDTIAEAMNWRGDETVLDVGTGSGILLFACAKQLRKGKATGIDIYDPNAGGGSAEIFWRNARAEGVDERVELLNVDARKMLFADGSFDVIVSSLAMHHMGAGEDRRRASEEMVRVLKPGGKIAICDLSRVLGECEAVLRRDHLINVQRRPYLRLFSILSAEKAENQRAGDE